MKKTPDQESLIEFPCRFPIKVIGKAAPELSQVIFDIIVKHAPDLNHDDIAFRHSTNKNYISLTITIQATNQAQLDQIYLELTSHKLIKYVL